VWWWLLFWQGAIGITQVGLQHLKLVSGVMELRRPDSHLSHHFDISSHLIFDKGIEYMLEKRQLVL
jgi:hypothetical protein